MQALLWTSTDNYNNSYSSSTKIRKTITWRYNFRRSQKCSRRQELSPPPSHILNVTAAFDFSRSSAMPAMLPPHLPRNTASARPSMSIAISKMDMLLLRQQNQHKNLLRTSPRQTPSPYLQKAASTRHCRRAWKRQRSCGRCKRRTERGYGRGARCRGQRRWWGRGLSRRLWRIR